MEEFDGKEGEEVQVQQIKVQQIQVQQIQVQQIQIVKRDPNQGWLRIDRNR
jgi:hypothetical protein